MRITKLRSPIALLGAFAMVALATPAQADEYCPARPGINTPPCVIEPGRVSLEVGAVDWTRDTDAGVRSFTTLIGSSQLRAGVSDALELSVSWTPYGQVRTHAGTLRDHASSTGDVTLAAKTALIKGDDSHKFSLSVQPSVTLPTGGKAIGAGTWGAQLIAPVDYKLTDTVALFATPMIGALPNDDGHGRHFAIGSAGGASVSLGNAVTVAAEAQWQHDDMAGGGSDQWQAGVSAGWLADADTQFDVGTRLGLNHAAPDVALYAGVAHQF